jgi:phospho-N-acetylmuramoyl-pentapeptide-transferase
LAICIHFLFIKFLLRQHIYQHIYDLSPSTHQKKKHVPSFGGIPLLLCFLLGLGIFTQIHPKIIWATSLFFGFSFIGFLDDFTSFKGGGNKGLTASQKFVLQWLMSVIGVGSYHFFIAPISIWEAGLFSFLFVGVSNATNLTDGLDGLLAGCALITLVGFLCLSSLLLPLLQPVLCVLILSICAFLLFNRYPASLFMGDTGSLGLGAFFVALAMLMENPWILLSLCTVYLVETLSVMIQVVWFKRTRKRVFLMAPLHHHFEMLGIKEPLIVAGFWMFGGICLSIFLLGVF